MKFLGNLSGYAKTLIVLAVFLSLNIGLCGITNSAAMKYGGLFNMPRTGWPNFLSWASVIEMYSLILATIAFVLVLIAWPIHAVVRRAAQRTHKQRRKQDGSGNPLQSGE
jgi:hypothetical protein